MKILLVDDEPIVRRGLRQMIRNFHAPFKAILEASNGQEAIILTRQYRPEIVLLDIRMPGLDGVTAANMIKQVDRRIKIIFLTAYAQFDYAQAAIRCGVRDYLVKPVHPDQLEQAITACLEESSETYVALPDGNLTRAQQLVASAVSYILQNYMRPLRLEDLARQAHVSPAYLSYLFSQEQGQTCIEFLTATRLHRAKELLAFDVGSSISDIAWQVGYENTNYFSRVFKRYIGVTPTEYRKNSALSGNAIHAVTGESAPKRSG